MQKCQNSSVEVLCRPSSVTDAVLHTLLDSNTFTKLQCHIALALFMMALATSRLGVKAITCKAKDLASEAKAKDFKAKAKNLTF